MKAEEVELPETPKLLHDQSTPGLLKSPHNTIGIGVYIDKMYSTV